MDLPFDFIIKAGLALAVGGLIGLERAKLGHSLIGVRSFALVALLGLMVTIIPFQPDVALPAIGLMGTFILAFLYYYFKTVHVKGAWGITTALMLPFVFFLSVLIGRGFLFEAGVAAIAATFLLAEKREVHAITNTISKQEITDALIFAILAFIVYPFLPEAPLDFLGQAIYLRDFWFIVVVISAIAFSAHLLLKYARKRALFYSSVLGGAVSSVAVLALFVKKTRDIRVLRSVLITSSLGTLSSDIILIAAISPILLLTVAPFFILAWLVFAAISFTEYKHAKSVGHLVALDAHPLSLKFTFEFAFVFFIVSLLVGWASSFSQEGVILAAFAGGLVSSTSVFASIAYLHAAHGLSLSTVLYAFAASLAASLLVRASMVSFRCKDGWKCIAKPVILLFAGILAGLLVNLFIPL
ncbi:MAG: DUF4010 domain-containing protein [Candidatus Micrarchaeota archaeon]